LMVQASLHRGGDGEDLCSVGFNGGEVKRKTTWRGR